MTISARELRWAIIVTVIALAVANAPTVIGFLIAPHGTTFSGISSIAPGDLNVYLSYLEQVRHGHFIFSDLFTGELQAANVVNPFWLGLGLLGSVLHLVPLATYFFARVVLGAALCLLIYTFAAYYYDDVLRRRVAFLLAVFASGIGAWIEPILRVVRHGSETMPMDLWVSEAFTFLSLRHSPHFLAVSMLIITSVWMLIRSVERDSMRYAVYAGISMLALFSFHPFHVVSLAPITVALAVTTWLTVRRQFTRQCVRFVVAWGIAAPTILYQALLIIFDPMAKGRAAENILVTPALGITLASYGFLLVGAIVGSVYLIKSGSLRNRLLVAWLVAHSLSIYAPIFFNRRVTHGLDIVMGVCAAAAAPVFFAWTRRHIHLPEIMRAAVVSVGLVLAFAPSNLWVLGQDLSFYTNEGRALPSLFYLTADERGAFEWLEVHGTDTTVVLCGTIMGNFVPGRSGRRVVVGHNVETIDIINKLVDVKKYFTPGTDDAWRRAYLQKNRVTEVLVSRREQRLGPFNTEHVPYLIPEYTSPTVTLYHVAR